MKTIITKNERQTIALGKRLAKKFSVGTVVVLDGELGAGKTVLVKGIAKGLHIKEPITSPTFTIMNEYQSGKMPLYHFDMYRIEDSSEVLEFGLSEYFMRSENTTFPQGVAVIEWAQNIADLIPNKNLITITITKLNEHTRKIEVEETL